MQYISIYFVCFILLYIEVALYLIILSFLLEEEHTLQPTVIFLIGSAGSGKSTIGQWIAQQYNYCYLDKDTICNTFTGELLELKGYSRNDRDGCAYYSEVVMPLEYQALLNIANDNVQLGRSVVLDAPFLSYFPDPHYITNLIDKYGWQQAHVNPVVLQITVDDKVLRTRMQERNLERDQWKFDHWDAFIEGLRSKHCLWEGIRKIQFDNSSATIHTEHLKEVLDIHSIHE